MAFGIALFLDVWQWLYGEIVVVVVIGGLVVTLGDGSGTLVFACLILALPQLHSSQTHFISRLTRTM